MPRFVTTKVVLWDLDGTILDPNGSIRAAIDHAVTSQGHEPFDADDRNLIGKDLRTILAMRDDDPARISAMVDAFRDYYTNEAWQLARFIPGVREIIDRLHADGIAQAIVTTKGEQEAIDLMANLEFAYPFATIVGDDDVRPIKPDPAPIEAACGRLGFQPTRGSAIMIGDTIYDIVAGRDAGATTTGVLWGHGEAEAFEAAGADHVVSDAGSLERVIYQWAKGGERPG